MATTTRIPNFIARYAKAIVAVLVLAVAAIANALGVETGIDVGEWAGVVTTTILVTLGVYAVPNRQDPADAHRVPMSQRLDVDGRDSVADPGSAPHNHPF